MAFEKEIGDYGTVFTSFFFFFFSPSAFTLSFFG